jgi:hypothetical protein
VDGLDVVVVVGFLVVVVVDDFDFLESLSAELCLTVVAVVDVGGGGAGATVVVVDDEGTAAVPTRGPDSAPGRGSELAGGVGAGVDVASAEGLAGAASVGGEVGGGVSGVGAAATSFPGAAETVRAAWRARRTSGWDRGDTREVENRDETSCTPNNPRSTPLAVPRAHVTTRTRRTAKWWCPLPHEGVKTTLNQRQGSRLGQ